MNDRIFQDVYRIKEYIDKEAHLHFLKVTQETNKASIYFKVHEQSGDMLFCIIFDKNYPTTPPMIQADKNLKTENIYRNKYLCLDYGIDNWNSNIEVLKIMKSFEKLFKKTPSNWILLNKAKDTEHNREYHNELRVNDGFLLKDNEEIIRGLIESKTVNVVKYINDYGKMVVTLLDSHTKIHNNTSDVEQIPVEKMIHHITQNSKYFKKGEDNLLKIKIDYIKKKYDKRDFIIVLNNNIKYYKWNENVHEPVRIFKYESQDSKPKINNSRICILGAGSLGSILLESLISISFTNFLLIDNDYLFDHNIHRHTLNEEYIGMQKTLGLKQKYENEHEGVQIDAFTYDFGENVNPYVNSCLVEELTKCSIIFDTTSNDLIISAISDICEENNIPYLGGSVVGDGSSLLVLKYNPKSNVNLIGIILEVYNNPEIHDLLEKRNLDGYYMSEKSETWNANKNDVMVLAGIMVNLAGDFIREEYRDYYDIYLLEQRVDNWTYDGMRLHKYMARKNNDSYGCLCRDEVENGKTLFEDSDKQ